MSSASSIFSLDGITLEKNGTIILDNLSAIFSNLSPCLLMGPNGCGKTSLLRLLHGLESPTSGIIDWHIESLSHRLHRSLVFQSPILLPRTVLDNIAYPQFLRGMSRSDARSLAFSFAERVGIADKCDLSAFSLSGGERQKLALARALITDPQLLFLDEPTANIDDRSTRDIESLLTDISATGTYVIMASHDRSQASRLARSVVLMCDGRVLDYGSFESVVRRPTSSVSHSYFSGDIVG